MTAPPPWLYGCVRQVTPIVGQRSLFGPAAVQLQRSPKEWEGRIKGRESPGKEGGVAGEDGNSCDWVADSATRDTARK